MHSVTLIYPHQLYEAHPALQGTASPVFLIEDPLFFSQYQFHKLKLFLHRSSMLWYADTLRKKGFTVHYIEARQLESTREIFRHLSKDVREVHMVDPCDEWLLKKLQGEATQRKINLRLYENPNFLLSQASAKDFCAPDAEKVFFHHFYIRQRKSMKILLDGDKPRGGKWSFDEDNRKRLPKNVGIPERMGFELDVWDKQALESIEKDFPKNPGTLDSLWFPRRPEQARAWLQAFLRDALPTFGAYEDAISQSESFLFHSALTPCLNIGMISPAQILDETLSFAKKTEIPLSSLEGFTRQIIGWREFVRASYLRFGTTQRTMNFWKHKRKLPQSFYTASTGIPPVDTSIRKVLQHGYSHHIERLMILGNFMLLCEIRPDDVYQWFMEMYVDAYDWVMVPNVYGMSQFADGGIITTKPYISSSNYVLKMSDFPKGEWCEIWDGLFWRFLNLHKDFFSSNPRMLMLLRTFDKMEGRKKETLLLKAENYLSTLNC